MPQVWNEIIADNQHNLGKLGTVKVHSYDSSIEGINVYSLFAVNAPIENGLILPIELAV